MAHYAGPDSFDFAYALALDDSRNVYVTGESGGDYATIKYSSDGVEEWIARYIGPSDSTDRANALAVDGQGNIYVTGVSWGLGTDRDYATIKYNSDGVEQWVSRYNGPGNLRDAARGLAIDGQGNVYVTGLSWGSGTERDYAIIRYNSDGVEQWVARYNSPGNLRDEAEVVVVDGQGDVYVTGLSWGSGTDNDYATIKYNSDGVEQWVARYNGPGNSGDGAFGLAVDGQGNVYVTGLSWGSGTGYDYATIKYNSDGVEQWVARYNGPANSNDEPGVLAVDGQGNIYVTGRSYGSVTDWDYATIKYNSDGVEQWVARYNGSGNGFDDARALAVDGEGNVYVTGRSYGSVTNRDYATIKYNSDGVEDWVARYNRSGNDFDDATALAVDGQGNVYVTGYSLDSGGLWSIYTTIKYMQIPTSVEEQQSEIPTVYSLSQNYPNPFNPSSTIEYDLPEPNFVTLAVYDMLGREVAVLVQEQKQAGRQLVKFNAEGLASGIYVYRMQASTSSRQAGRFVDVKKLVLIR